jgi:5-hydroxyisourate hydrolase
VHAACVIATSDGAPSRRSDALLSALDDFRNWRRETFFVFFMALALVYFVAVNYHMRKPRAAAAPSYNQHLAHFDALAKAGEMGRLTTHILDTTHGSPAAGVAIRLYTLDGARQLLASAVSNADGRTEKPLLDDEAMKTGSYELEFDIGDYFATRAVSVDDPAFLDTVLIRFSIKAEENYHVPLLVSPWSYSTYRGS